MFELLSLKEALEQTKDMDRTLLLGNGFSIAYDHESFSYHSLLEKSEVLQKRELNNLFDTLETKDFEEVIHALEFAAQIASAYTDQENQKRYVNDAQTVRSELIKAIHSVHPDIHYDINESRKKSCGEFVGEFQAIFTLNYDLLLYWVRLNYCKNLNDGFGRGDRSDGFIGPFSPDAYCDVYNLHGGLHLFINEKGQTQKILETANPIVRNIENSIAKGKLPLIVAEGSSPSKLKKIKSTPYLLHCYEKLKSTSGAIFIFGHSADRNDAHIYKAIFHNCTAPEVFFCINGDGENAVMQGKLAAMLRGKDDVKISFIDVENMGLWSSA